MSASPHDQPQVTSEEPSLRFRHIPLLLVALSAAVTQPYAQSIAELLLAAGLTVLGLTPPVAQLLRYIRQRPGRDAQRSASPVRDWFWALGLVALANLVYLINLLILRGSLLAR